MSKILSLLAISILTLPLIACSSNGGPSNSDVKKLVIEELNNTIRSERMKDTLKVDNTECEPTSTENRYECIITVSGEGDNGKRGSATRNWMLDKANGKWFITGPF